MKQKNKKELDMEQWTGSKLEKEYVKAVYCNPVCLIYCLFKLLSPEKCWVG